jgi:hypothetical protein
LKFFIWNFRVVMLLIFQGSLFSPVPVKLNGEGGI